MLKWNWTVTSKRSVYEGLTKIYRNMLGTLGDRCLSYVIVKNSIGLLERRKKNTRNYQDDRFRFSFCKRDYQTLVCLIQKTKNRSIMVNLHPFWRRCNWVEISWFLLQFFGKFPKDYYSKLLATVRGKIKECKIAHYHKFNNDEATQARRRVSLQVKKNPLFQTFNCFNNKLRIYRMRCQSWLFKSIFMNIFSVF